MSNVELPALRNRAIDGNKRFRRVVPLITATALTASLLAGAAGPASAAVREPARTAPISLAFSDNSLPAASLAAAARYVHASDGRLILDAANAEKAGVGSQALNTESASVASLNKLLARDTATVTAEVVPAAAQDTVIQILPGVTLTINSVEIQLYMTKQAVTELENLVGFGQAVASLVGSILAIATVSTGAQIAAIVAAALGLFNSGIKLCTAPDGSLTVTIPWLGHGLPSCSGFTLA